MRLCNIDDIKQIKQSSRIKTKHKELWQFDKKEIYQYHVYLDILIEYLEKRNEKTKSKIS
jgi:hypothetical protein